MGLRGPKSINKSIMSHVFTDFYVPALTPRLNSIATSLQFSESIALITAVEYIRAPSPKRLTWTPGI